MTVGELLSRASSNELSEWMAYSRIKNNENRQRELERKAADNANKGRGRR